MDLLAALALVVLLEGLALVVFARSVPELMAAMSEIDPARTRGVGLVCVVLGAAAYLYVRGAFAG